MKLTAPLHHIKHRLSEYEHRQRVILSAVIALLLLAVAFNKYVLNKSVLILNISQPGVEILVDGQKSTLEDLGGGRYKLVTVPGKHTITITADGAIHHKEVVSLRTAGELELTPALTIAPDVASDEIGAVRFVAHSSEQNSLFYLGGAGRTLTQYRLDSGQKIALSDPVFSQVSALSWAPDFRSVIVKSHRGNWYSFDFRKPDFRHAEFIGIGGPAVFSINHDPAHADRVGFVEWRDNAPVFGTATPGLAEKRVLTVASDLTNPSTVWAPSGRLVALLDDPRYNRSNAQLYDLAQDILLAIPAFNVERAVFNDSGSRLLLETADGADALAVYDLETRQVQTVGPLAVAGGATWLDDERVLALTETAGQPVLAAISVVTGATTALGATPVTTSPIEGFFVTIDRSTLLFVMNETLFTFPLTWR